MKRFRDNDGLAALLATQLNADLLMLCTDVDGLFTGNPADPASEYIPTYCPEVCLHLAIFLVLVPIEKAHHVLRAFDALDRFASASSGAAHKNQGYTMSPCRSARSKRISATYALSRLMQPLCCDNVGLVCNMLRILLWLQVHEEMISFASKSTHGRGGMMAKVEAAWMAAEQGCSVVILNGKKPDSILQACALGMSPWSHHLVVYRLDAGTKSFGISSLHPSRYC